VGEPGAGRSPGLSRRRHGRSRLPQPDARCAGRAVRPGPPTSQRSTAGLARRRARQASSRSPAWMRATTCARRCRLRSIGRREAACRDRPRSRWRRCSGRLLPRWQNEKHMIQTAIERHGSARQWLYSEHCALLEGSDSPTGFDADAASRRIAHSPSGTSTSTTAVARSRCSTSHVTSGTRNAAAAAM